MLDETTGYPEDSGNSEPTEHTPVIGGKWMVLPQNKHDIGCFADLNRHIGQSKYPAFVSESTGDGRCHHQTEQHDAEQKAAYLRRFRVEPVCHPAGILPAEPYCEPEDQRFDNTGERQIMQKFMTELRNRENIDQIEEQFLECHPGMVPVSLSQKRM